jgi:glycosyltransferase involved in cell wall biosynthesis
MVTQAIDSVIGQQYEGLLEIVVVDDGSTDGTIRELTARYAARNVPSNRRLVIHANPHTGMTGTMGKGIELCSGDYVSMCDSDDLWEPARAAELLAEVEKTPNALIHTTCKMRMLDGFQLPNRARRGSFEETDNLFDKLGYTPLEYPGNVTLYDWLLGQQWRGPRMRGSLAIFPRTFVQGEFAMPAGSLWQEVWLTFAAMVQGTIRYAGLNSYVQRIHGENDSLPGPSTSKGLDITRGNLVFLEHAIPILRRHAGCDRSLLRRVETRAHVDRYRLNVSAGLSLREALKGVSLSDVLAEPRELLSYTLRAKAPALHDFLSRTRQSLTGKGPAGQARPSKPFDGR